jgi:hypothetical protein
LKGTDVVLVLNRIKLQRGVVVRQNSGRL